MLFNFEHAIQEKWAGNNAAIEKVGEQGKPMHCLVTSMEINMANEASPS